MGAHQIEYSVEASSIAPDCSLESVTGKGTFQVVIISPDDRAIRAALEGYAAQPKSLDYWAELSAEEAFLAADSLLVVPYIRGLIESRGTTATASPVLAKFKGEPEVESLLLGTARRGKRAEAAAALGVLAGWRYAVSEAAFSLFLERAELSVRVAAIQYAAALRSQAYLSAIMPRRTARIGASLPKRSGSLSC